MWYRDRYGGDLWLRRFVVRDGDACVQRVEDVENESCLLGEVGVFEFRDLALLHGEEVGELCLGQAALGAEVSDGFAELAGAVGGMTNHVDNNIVEHELDTCQ